MWQYLWPYYTGGLCLSWQQYPNLLVDTSSEGCHQTELYQAFLACGTRQKTGSGRPSGCNGSKGQKPNSVRVYVCVRLCARACVLFCCSYKVSGFKVNHRRGQRIQMDVFLAFAMHACRTSPPPQPPHACEEKTESPQQIQTQ